MKIGKSLTELAREIEERAANKVDFVTPTDKLELAVEDDRVRLYSPVGDFDINGIAHQQIGSHTGIPKPYYDKMLAEEPFLLTKNVNTWLHKNPKTQMVRAIKPTMRAMLSDRYRPLENEDLAEAVLPVLASLNVEVISSEITDRRLYLKVVDKRITKDIPTGRKLGDGSHVFFDTLSPAMVISNSEVGMGALSIETGIYTKMCTNLAIVGERSMRKYHVGRRLDLGEEIYALLSAETRHQTDKAVWMQVRDMTKAAFDEVRFRAQTDELGKLVDTKLEGDPVKIVSLASKKLGMTEAEGSSVLRHLIQGGELTGYGLFNAVTRSAEDVEDYDRATDFERFGGKLIDLPESEWKELALAA